MDVYFVNQTAKTDLRFLVLNRLQKIGIARCQVYTHIFFLGIQHLFVLLYKIPLILELLVFVKFFGLFITSLHFLLDELGGHLGPHHVHLLGLEPELVDQSSAHGAGDHKLNAGVTHLSPFAVVGPRRRPTKCRKTGP